MSTRLELLKRYLIEDPSDSFLRYAIAMEYISSNDQNDALEQLKNLINDDPDYLAAYYMAAKAAENLNLIPLARKFYETGISVATMQKDLHTASELRAALEMIEE